MTKKISNKMKALTVAATISCVLGGGAAVLLPAGIAAASPSQSAGNAGGHVRNDRRADDRIGHVRLDRRDDFRHVRLDRRDDFRHVRLDRRAHDPIRHH